jgi:hypothetical protein
MNSPDDKLEPEAALRFVVDEIKECNIILEAFVADAPERCACKGLRSLAGKYRLLLNFIVLHVFVALILLLICLLSCDVCLSKGKTVKRFVRHNFKSAEFQAIGLNIFPYFFGILLNSYDPPVTDDDTFR